MQYLVKWAGRSASENVTLELLKSKCIPVLIFGLECFSLPKSDLTSLNFAITRFVMKLFRSSNTEVIAECQSDILEFMFQMN